MQSRKHHLRLDPVSIHQLAIATADKEGGFEGVFQVEAGAGGCEVAPLGSSEVHHTGGLPLHLLILTLPAPPTKQSTYQPISLLSNQPTRMMPGAGWELGPGLGCFLDVMLCCNQLCKASCLIITVHCVQDETEPCNILRKGCVPASKVQLTNVVFEGGQQCTKKAQQVSICIKIGLEDKSLRSHFEAADDHTALRESSASITAAEMRRNRASAVPDILTSSPSSCCGRHACPRT